MDALLNSLDIAEAVLFGIMLTATVFYGRQLSSLYRSAWLLIIIGIALLLVGETLDIVLSYDKALSSTPVPLSGLLLEKLLGSVMGSLLLTLGLYRWLRILAERSRSSSLPPIDLINAPVIPLAQQSSPGNDWDQFLGAVFRVVDVAIVVLDRQGRVVFTNDGLCRLTGQTHHSLLGQSLATHLAGESRASLQRLLQQRSSATPSQDEWLIQDANGLLRVVQVGAIAMVSEGNHAFRVVALTDITERKATENALRDSRNYLTTLFNSADIGLCLTDAEARFVMVNDAYCRIYGYQREELLGKEFTLVIPPAGRRYARRIHDEYIAGSPESAGEWDVVRKDGTPRKILVTAGRLIHSDGSHFKVTTVQDITERKRQEQTLLSESRQQLTEAQHLAHLGNWRFDPVTGTLSGSEEIWHIFGHSPDFPLPHPVRLLCQVQRQDRRELVRELRQLPHGPGELRRELAIHHHGGGQRFVLFLARHEPEPDQPPGTLYGIIQDITDRKQAELTLQETVARMEYLALHDTLTGLANRALFQQRVQQTITRHQRRPSPFACLFVDLDHFKPVNDLFGHQAGDQLLQQVAQRLQNTVRAVDSVARLGGDEFALLLEDISNVSTAEQIAAKLCQTLAEPFTVVNQSVVISASIGIALFPDDSHDLDTLLIHADQAMYNAKQAGRSAYRRYHPSMTTQSVD